MDDFSLIGIPSVHILSLSQWSFPPVRLHISPTQCNVYDDCLKLVESGQAVDHSHNSQRSLADVLKFMEGSDEMSRS